MTFAQQVAEYLNGLQFPTTCTDAVVGCPDPFCGTPHFSFESCPCCKSPDDDGGERYPVHALDPSSGTVHMDVCHNCREFIASGVLPKEKV